MPAGQLQGARNASARTQAKRPGDLTGVRGQQLATRAAKEKAESRSQVEQALEDDRLAKLATDVDYTSDGRQAVRDAVASGDVEEGEVEVRPKTRRIRVAYEISDMTFGREVVSPDVYDDNGVLTRPAVLGSLRTYSFEEGRWYVVDSDLADHLTYLGYVFD